MIGSAGATGGAQRVWLEILEVVIVARLFVRAGSPAGDCLAVMRTVTAGLARRFLS